MLDLECWWYDGGYLMACLGGLMAVKLLVEDSLMKMEWKFVVDDDVMWVKT